MNKKFQKIFFVGATLVAFAGMTVACKDYDDDIDALTEQVNSLSSQVSSLQASINAGSVITNVAKTSDGITVTLSNGQSYTITNGKDGANGTNGTNGKDGKDGANGTVITVGENGNWYIDGVDSGLAAAGKDGVDGDTIYYVPGEDGYWYKVTNGGEPEKTDISCFPAGTLTAVWDDAAGTLTVYNAEGATEPIVLTCKATLASLVFIPELYVDGIEAISSDNFYYLPLDSIAIIDKKSTLDSKNEQWLTKYATADGAKYVEIGLPVKAQYHVNPTNAAIDETFNFSTNIINAEFETKARGEIEITPSFAGVENGVLSVTLAIEGWGYNYPFSQDSVTVFNLVASKDTVNVASDYAMLDQNWFGDVRIAMAGVSEDYHYRTGLAEADPFAGAKVREYPVWTEGSHALSNAEAQSDTVVAYNSTLDLNKIVEAHYFVNMFDGVGADKAISEEKMNDLGLTWDFSVVKNYVIGKTDQADFVTLENGIFTPKVYSEDGEAAIGRTPIIRIKLMRGNDVVAVAYMKVYIGDEALPDITMDLGELKPEEDETICDGVSAASTVKQMNVELYNILGYSKTEFHSLYKFVDLEEADSLGRVTESKNQDAEGTRILTWTLTQSQLWKNADIETLSHKVAYVLRDDESKKIVITLTAALPKIQSVYPLTSVDNYIAEYWNGTKDTTYYNVYTPDMGETDATKCVFVNDINASFVTKNGQTVVADGVTNVSFYFCKDMEEITAVGSNKVTFEVSEDGTVLSLKALNGKKVTLEKDAVIATIDNSGTEVPYNTITLNKENDNAKLLLNTNELTVLIGATGNVCNGDQTVDITFDGADHFVAKYVRPINIAEKSADNFIDAVDFGEDGSFIAFEDLLDPVDWRGRVFNPDYTNYWQYYGPFTITVDPSTATCDLNGKVQAVPETIKLEAVYVEDPGTEAVFPDNQSVDKDGNPIYTSRYGWITYRNNGAHVKSFNIFVKATVNYGWGTIKTGDITIPVAETIGETN